MNHRIKQFFVAAASLGCALTASAAERNPALDLLVKKGIITAEERAQALEQAAVAKLSAGPREIPWYETIKIDGYTQVRHTEQLNDAAYLTGALPADRSVDANQSLIIRRGRFKISGDITPRLYLYSQFDLAGSVAFDLPGTTVRPDRVRFGFDVDHKLSANTLLNLSAHVSTVGEAHDVSAAISIRRAF